jgi:hypothetical protein
MSAIEAEMSNYNLIFLTALKGGNRRVVFIRRTMHTGILRQTRGEMAPP